jgi:hypothetical protein
MKDELVDVETIENMEENVDLLILRVRICYTF